MSTARVATCIGCGCDDFHACPPDGCYWLRVDYREHKGVCSECEEHVEAWDRGDRTPRAVPAAELEAIASGEQRIPRPEQQRPQQHQLPRMPPGQKCPHDWPFEDVRDSDSCRWCGMSFPRHIFTECP